jgi:hypothetical protein
MIDIRKEIRRSVLKYVRCPRCAEPCSCTQQLQLALASGLAMVQQTAYRNPGVIAIIPNLIDSALAPFAFDFVYGVGIQTELITLANSVAVEAIIGV